MGAGAGARSLARTQVSAKNIDWWQWMDIASDTARMEKRMARVKVTFIYLRERPALFQDDMASIQSLESSNFASCRARRGIDNGGNRESLTDQRSAPVSRRGSAYGLYI